jgi:hypothetical protein
MRKLFAIAALSGLAMLAPASAGATPFSYTFPGTDPQGWRVYDHSNDAPATAVTTAGNPPGSLLATDTAAETGCPDDPFSCDFLSYYNDSASLAGNRSANYGGALSFDLTSSTTPDSDPEVAIRGTFDLLFRDPPAPAGVETGWRTITVPLTEAGWTFCPEYAETCAPASQAQFKSVLATVGNFQIIADMNTGMGETYGLDNVTLTDAPLPPPAAPPAAAPTGLRAAALKKCAKIKNKKNKKKCKKRAKKLPA